MTTEELSNKFDVLINSYSIPQSFGTNYNPLNFDEYEKSIFLTQAQDYVIQGLYTGSLGYSFEQTEQLRRYLSSLVNTKTYNCENTTKGLESNSVIVHLDDDVLFITYESAIISDSSKCLNNKELKVIPTTQDQYHRIKDNPFRGSNKRRILRLDINNNTVELISKYTIKQYLVRYISRPNPIILTDLPENLTINNQNKKTECILNPEIYDIILKVAVNNAINSRISKSQD